MRIYAHLPKVPAFPTRGYPSSRGFAWLEKHFRKFGIGFFVLQIILFPFFLFEGRPLFSVFALTNMMVVIPYIFPAKSSYTYTWPQKIGDFAIIPTILALTYFGLAAFELPSAFISGVVGAAAGVLFVVFFRYTRNNIQRVEDRKDFMIGAQVRNYLPRVPLDPPAGALASDDFDERWRKAQSLTEARWDEAIKGWKSQEAITVERRLLLIAAGITPTRALDSETQEMSEEDLIAMKALRDLSQEDDDILRF